MSGRFHMYEGYGTREITFPVRVMRALGAEFMLISNVSGGMNPQFKPGDLMILDDHINLLGENPLVGPNDERLGKRYPDMSAPYDRELISLAKRIALEEGIQAHTGVYVALTGPCLETRAEYRFLRMIGADVVGMSTVPEVIVGVHAGFRVLGVSVITDECLPDRLKPADIREIIAIANQAQPKLTRLFKRVIREAK
jgi:purine-nucleoside phosphorylase